ncbi:MAG TPA: hypothetical protein VJZ76_00135 [Thermoanaerobaculia bacterium]|nr:hypothetical protein [Thermoanaerobaculia bacterium]
MPERFSGPYARDAHRDGIGEDVALRCRGVHDVLNALRVAACDDEIAIGKASE